MTMCLKTNQRGFEGKGKRQKEKWNFVIGYLLTNPVPFLLQTHLPPLSPSIFSSSHFFSLLTLCLSLSLSLFRKLGNHRQ